MKKHFASKAVFEKQVRYFMEVKYEYPLIEVYWVSVYLKLNRKVDAQHQGGMRGLLFDPLAVNGNMS